MAPATRDAAVSSCVQDEGLMHPGDLPGQHHPIMMESVSNKD